MTMDRIRTRESGPRSYVGIAVGATRYALDVRRVREIVRPSPVAPLPAAATGLVGVAYHRGEVVAVVDVRTRLTTKLEATAPPASSIDTSHDAPGLRDRSRWVLARTREGRLVALVVDDVEGVYASSPREAQAPPPVAGVHLRAGALVLELDVDALAAPAALVALPSAEGPVT